MCKVFHIIILKNVQLLLLIRGRNSTVKSRKTDSWRRKDLKCHSLNMNVLDLLCVRFSGYCVKEDRHDFLTSIFIWRRQTIKQCKNTVQKRKEWKAVMR